MHYQQVAQRFIYRINQSNAIFFVNDAWLDFAQENQAFELNSDAVLSKSLWSFVSGLETQHLYGVMLDKVRTGQAPIKVPFRCDGPECRRYMELKIFPLPYKGLEFRSRILKIEPRDSVKVLDMSVDRSSDFIRMCSWCKKVYTGELLGWVEVEKAMQILDLFSAVKLPHITHGMCPDCYESCLQELAA
jgi:hypothetical protein